MLHGYAVAYGILVEGKIAENLGLLTAKEYLTIVTLFAELGIVGKALKKIDINALIKMTQLDKKAQIGKAYYVLLKGLGRVYKEQGKFAYPVTDEVVKQAFLQVGVNE